MDNQQPDDTLEGMTPRVAEIPLFPLNLVLFPNMILPLHIFEERYKQMVRYCMEASQPFGIVLVQEAHREDGTVETFPIGCTARIARVERLPDGRMNIDVIGERRFKILDTHEQQAYRVGLTEPYQDFPVDPDDVEPLAAEVQALLREFLTLSLELQGQQVGEIDLPVDPEPLSFTAACVLPLDNTEKQNLLSTQDPASRLLVVQEYLKRENSRLQEIKAVSWHPVETAQYEPYRSQN